VEQRANLDLLASLFVLLLLAVVLEFKLVKFVEAQPQTQQQQQQHV